MNDVAKYFASMEGSNLQIGMTLPNAVCPVCNGGPHYHRTFSISRTPVGLAYICYRASCGVKGYVEGGPAPAGEGIEKPTISPYLDPIYPLSPEDTKYFRERFNISQVDSKRFIQVGNKDQYVFPIRGPDSGLVGHVLRQPTWKGNPPAPRTGSGIYNSPKATTRMSVPGAVGMSWYRRYSKALVVVEDPVSAISTFSNHEAVDTVALLGTLMTVEKARDIQRQGYDEVLIALDEDATGKAFQIARTFGMSWKSTRVVLLAKDLKDTDPDELPEILGID